ncbi:MAG TPA: 1-deoxy-D-xylulose-5-phosphate reductoisomerase [Terriglobales bacterium]|nr:1-deoxy-D-xylulose-5-phosphate reductoisomerase [Terriglobales bacterium]
MSPPPPRRLALLGSTGSIGRNVLDVVRSLPGQFEIVGLAAGDNVAALAEQIAAVRPRVVALRTAEAAARLRRSLGPAARQVEILHGREGLRAVATASGAQMLVAAIVGVAGLEAIHAALAAGCDLALANKEALVVAGSLLLAEARRSGAAVLPVDSEHSAIHQCLRAGAPAEVQRLVLTASGGPLRQLSAAELAQVTPAQALRHPTWSMGDRISLDSATLMNKGFEVIEACHLFGLPDDRVEVLIHPQSIVHSLVEFVDGSVMAQLGTADMRTPIQYALSYPARLPAARMRLKLEEVGKLEFGLPDVERFPCLRLAREAWRAGGGAAAVLNAADEVALAAFAAGRLGFAQIAAVVEQCLQRLGAPAMENLDAVLELDARARRVATELLARFS